MTSQKKILFVINTVSPYQLDFFNKLNKYVNLKLIFHIRNYVNYKLNLVIFGGYRLPHNSKFISFIKNKKIQFFYWLEKLNEKIFGRFE